jgi:hypothetical protein
MFYETFKRLKFCFEVGLSIKTLKMKKDLWRKIKLGEYLSIIFQILWRQRER